MKFDWKGMTFSSSCSTADARAAACQSSVAAQGCTCLSPEAVHILPLGLCMPDPWGQHVMYRCRVSSKLLRAACI